MRTLIAIPCYNCEKQIGRVLAGLTPEILARVDEVAVIDNRSLDGTLAAAVAAAQALGSSKVRVLRNIDNYGLGGSQKVAFERGLAAGMEAVIILHGDAQAETSEINLMLDTAEADLTVDAVLGSRFMPGSKLSGYDKVRIGGNIALNILYTLLSMRLTLDLGSGLNLFRTRIFSDEAFLGFSGRMTFNMDILLDLYSRQARIKFVPITWSETDQVSNARNVQVGWTALKCLLAWRTGHPIRVPDERRAGGYPSETIL